MKKYNLLKVIGFVFLAVIILTWIIPIGSYSNGAFVKGTTSPVGIFDLSRIPIMTIANMLQYGLTIILIGGLYGVLNKTGSYGKLITKIVNKLKGKEKVFLVISICILTLLNALIGLPYAFLIIVPFFITIIRKLGFDKLTSLISTIGAILIGNMCSLYGNDISLYINTYLSLGINDEIFTKIIFLIIVIFLLIMFVLKKSQLSENISKGETDKIPLYEENNKNKSIIPLIVIFLLCFILTLINMFNWNATFNITYFLDLYEKMTSITLLSNVIGSVSIFGSWSQFDMGIFLIFVTIIIGWLYSVKFKDFMDGYISGIKEVLAPAFYATIANIIFVTLYRFQTMPNMYLTITNFVYNTFGNMKLIATGLLSFIGGLFYNDITNFSIVLSEPIQIFITDTTKYQLVGIIIQSLHGIVMLFLPTSVLLMVGLSYLKISYKEWIKYIWKYLIQIIIISILILIIIGMFI